jgi:hypothetical protein
MARVRKHSLLSALSGAVGKELVFKQYGGTTVVSKYPDMEGIKATPLQQLQRDKMKAAQAHWRQVKRDAALRAQYDKELQPGKRLYNKVISEFMKKVDLQ